MIVVPLVQCYLDLELVGVVDKALGTVVEDRHL